MTSYSIPLTGAAELGAFKFTVDLDGVDFRLEFQYNSREGFWYFSLLDIGGNRLRSGIKVVSNYALLRLFQSLVRPEGELISYDTRQIPADPGLEDLDVNSIFGYIDAEEIAAL